MTASVIDFEGTILKHVDDTLTRYADFGPMLSTGETVVSATATCSDDALLVIGTPAVLAIDTIVPAKRGTRTITADEGVSFSLSVGTPIADDADPVRITIAATLSTGEIAVRTARLRVAE